MLMSLNRKIFNYTLNKTDKIVQPILRDKTYLRLNSFQLNTLLNIQKLVEVQITKVLKGMNIPTEKTLKGLYQTIYELEAEKVKCKKVLERLECKISDLELKLDKSFPPMPKKRAGISKKSPLRNSTPAN